MEPFFLLSGQRCVDGAWKMEENEKKSAKEKLKIMLKFIKKYALYSILDKEIYWKTRVMYLILK